MTDSEILVQKLFEALSSADRALVLALRDELDRYEKRYPRTVRDLQPMTKRMFGAVREAAEFVEF